MKYESLSVKDFLGKVRTGSVNLDDFYSRLFSEIKELQKKYNFFVTVSEKEAKAELKNLNKKGRLAGLPVSVKDNICTKGIQSAAGSRILEGYKPPFDASAVRRAKEQGGVVIGKTVQDEFGFGTFSANSGFGIPKNPLDPERSCGGSSGGAGGLTSALDFPHIALAESTGGSISCPASFCGVVGLTPTYGLVSRYGLIDFANSLDKIGPVGKSVEDVALMLSVISGYDDRDFTSIKSKQNFSGIRKGVKGMHVGIPREYFGEGVDEKVSEQVWSGVKKLESLGARYEKISLGMTKHAISTYYIIATSEASTNLAKFCGMRYGSEERIEGDFNEYFSRVREKYFGEEAKRRILLGTFARMAGYRDQYYLKAMKVRNLLIQEFKKAFKKYDVLVAPTMPVIAPKLSEIRKMSPLESYMLDILTVPPNLAGLPMISIPCSSVKGMPVGMHIIGDHLQEEKILRIAHNFERS